MALFSRLRRRWRRPRLLLGDLAIGLGLALVVPPGPGPALADPAPAPVVSSAYRIPLQTFTYHPDSQSTYYKYGINLALGGSSTPAMFEFDTGGDGFFAASGSAANWWGASTVPTGNSFSKSFDSGYTYDGQTLTTSISFFGLGSSPGSPIFSTPSNYVVGASDRIQFQGSNQWTASGGSTSPPVENNFYGDFGLTLKRGGNGIENILAQLTYGGDVSKGYSVSLAPYGSSGAAYLQLGLQTADLNNPATTWFAMQGADPSRPFANSNLNSFSAELLNGTLQLELGGSSSSLNGIGLNLDSGTPGVTLHYKDSDRSLLDPYSMIKDGDPVRLLPGVMLGLQAEPSGAALMQTLLNFQTGDNYGLNQVLTRRRGDGGVTYLNTGATLFQSYVVTYDLANQRIGLTAYPMPVPGPSPLAAGLISGAISSRLRALRRRIRAANAPHPSPEAAPGQGQFRQSRGSARRQ